MSANWVICVLRDLAPRRHHLLADELSDDVDVASEPVAPSVTADIGSPRSRRRRCAGARRWCRPDRAAAACAASAMAAPASGAAIAASAFFAAMRQAIDASAANTCDDVGGQGRETAAARLHLVGAQDGALERVDLDGHVGQPAHHFLFAAEAFAVFLRGRVRTPTASAASRVPAGCRPPIRSRRARRRRHRRRPPPRSSPAACRRSGG